MGLGRSSAVIGTLALLAAVLPLRAQQPAPVAGLPDGPQVFRTARRPSGSRRSRDWSIPGRSRFCQTATCSSPSRAGTRCGSSATASWTPAPITGLPLGITSARRDTAGVDVALHPRFAENRLVYVAYWKPNQASKPSEPPFWCAPASTEATSLTDVREIFASSSWTDGPSAARIVFGRDGKIYLDHRDASFPRALSGSRRQRRPGRRTRPSTPARFCV